MKSKRLFHAVLLSVFAWLFLMAGIAGAVTLTAGTAKLDLTPATAFANGESFYLLIKVSDATGVAGAALTVEYDPALFEVDETNVSGNDYFIATSNTFVTVTDTRTPPGDPASAVPSLGNQTTSGKVMLSGAFIDPNAETGGGGAYTGEQILFKVKFRAKAVGGPAVFTVKQSMLQNPAAGWGTVDAPEAAPVLVGAVAKTHADWANLALAFPVLLGDATHPFPVGGIPTEGITVTLDNRDDNANGLPDWWENKYGIYNATNAIDKNADYDHDGYSNLVEYQSYVSEASPGKNPTVVEAPGGTDYNPATDTRTYSISGTVSYAGGSGTLYVAAFDVSDTNFTTPIATQQYVWASGTASQSYTLGLANGTYVVGAYIGASATRQATDPQGSSAQVVLEGQNQTGKDIALILEPLHTILFQGSASMNKNGSGKFTLVTEIPAGKTLKAYNVQINYDSTKLSLAATNGVVATTTCPAAMVPTNFNTGTAGQVLFNGFNTTGVAGAATVNWLEFSFTGKGIEGDTQLTITVNNYGASTSDQFIPKVRNFNLKLVSFLRGDADGSGGTPDIFDALIVAEYDAQLKTAQELPGFAAADVDNSSTVDIFDALKIAEFDAGLIPNLD